MSLQGSKTQRQTLLHAATHGMMAFHGARPELSEQRPQPQVLRPLPQKLALEDMTWWSAGVTIIITLRVSLSASAL
jgi:hypothetical protein